MARSYLGGLVSVGNVARGTIAIGNVAVGVIAIGNVAIGGIAIGGAASVGIFTVSVNGLGLFAAGVNAVGIASYAFANGIGVLGVSMVNGFYSPWFGYALATVSLVAWLVKNGMPRFSRPREERLLAQVTLAQLGGGQAVQGGVTVRIVGRHRDGTLTLMDRAGTQARVETSPEVLLTVERERLEQVGWFVAELAGHGSLRVVGIRMPGSASAPFAFPPRNDAEVRRVLFLLWPVASLAGYALTLAAQLGLSL